MKQAPRRPADRYDPPNYRPLAVTKFIAALSATVFVMCAVLAHWTLLGEKNQFKLGGAIAIAGFVFVLCITHIMGVRDSEYLASLPEDERRRVLAEREAEDYRRRKREEEEAKEREARDRWERHDPPQQREPGRPGR